MGLYIRLQSSFYGSRKTLRLRSLIGDAAFWVPPRLWVYACTHQPNGDFSKYTAFEIASALDYRDDPQALLEALLEASFLDADMKLHDWSEHNEYHSVFAARAKKAAAARWNPAPPEKKRKDRKGKEQALLEHASSIPPTLDTEKFRKTWAEYIEFRESIKCKKLLEKSVAAQFNRLAEYGEPVAIAAIEASIANGWQGIFPEKVRPTAAAAPQRHIPPPQAPDYE